MDFIAYTATNSGLRRIRRKTASPQTKVRAVFSALAFVPSFAAGVHDGPVVSQGCSDDARTDPGR